MTETATERHRDLERLLTFIDAIVAIAVTLLVLPLAELAAHLGNGSVGVLLREHESQLWSFLLSFAVIARLWFVQHDAVRPLLLYDRTVARWLMAWAMTIVFLPFPTALLPDAGGQAATKILYIGTVGLSSALIAALEWKVVRTPEITGGQDVVPPEGSLVNVAILIVALTISLAVPATSYYPMLLLALDDRVCALLRRWGVLHRTASDS